MNFKLDEMEQHTETIKCPECNAIQEATVLHTIPFWTYVHECKKCKYIITESEWEADIELNEYKTKI
jgi:C4-type Zn-finger protein